MTPLKAIDPAHRDFHRRYSTLKPPLRPHGDVVEAIRSQLPQTDQPILLLGVTPELAMIPRQTIAVDWSDRMLAVAWPGDTQHRRAVVGDWRALPIDDASVAGAIGDGSLNMLNIPDDIVRVFDELRRVVKPRGRTIFRVYTTPEEGEPIDQVRQSALSGKCPFHAFKLRLNMATALEAGLENMPCDQVYRRFEQLFTDRNALAEMSGWSLEEIAEIDAYQGSPYVQCYPKRSRLLGIIPGWVRQAQFVETRGYPLAERCPLLVLDL